MSEYFQSDKFFEDYFTLMTRISLVNWAPCMSKPEFEQLFNSIMENIDMVPSGLRFENCGYYRYKNLEISSGPKINCYRYRPEFD